MSEQPEYHPHLLSFVGQTATVPKKALLEHIDVLLADIETNAHATIFPPTVVDPKAVDSSSPECIRDAGGLQVLKRSDGTADIGAKSNLYVGPLGHALMYFHLYCKSAEDHTIFGGAPDPLEELKSATAEGLPPLRSSIRYLHRARDILVGLEVQFEKKSKIFHEGVGFFCGLSGYLALKVAINMALLLAAQASQHPDETAANNFQALATTAIDSLLGLGIQVHDGPPQGSDTMMVSELLYGRAGYLWSLAFAFKHCPALFDSRLKNFSNTQGGIVSRLVSKLRKQSIIDVIAEDIIEDGLSQAKQCKSRGDDISGMPMIWDMFGKQYFGAAHGSVGIAYSLLMWYERLGTKNAKKLLELIDALCELAAPPNRYLGVAANDREWSHYWCHGYPGLIPLLAKAYTMFKTPRYLDVARHCAEIVWREGLLRKGRGLCHGVYGNAYCFLTMFRLTRENRYLFYATSFYHLSRTPEFLASVASYVDPQRGVQGVPDSPYSLMEGIAGEACFLIDLIYPDRSNFPGYETTTAPPISELLHESLYPLALPKAMPLTNHINKNARLFFPGIWVVNLMNRQFCSSFLDRVYASTTEQHKKTDAIRLGQEFSFEVNSLCGYVQHFVETQMLPSDISRCETSRHADVQCGDGDSYTTSSTQPAETLPEMAQYRAQLIAGADMRSILRTRADELKAESIARVREAFGASVEEGQQLSVVPTNKTPIHSIPRLHLWRSYVIRYDAESHPSIQSHTDACDVTFNLCLRRTCTKGHLVFNESNLGYTHEVGQGVIFWGNKVHHTHSVGESGERAQIVLLFNFMHDDDDDDNRNPAGSQHHPQRRSHFPMLDLPTEVQGVILSYLPVRDLAKVCYSCKALNEVATDDDAWMERFANTKKLTDMCPVEHAQNPPSCFLCTESRRDACLTKCEDCSRFFHLMHQPKALDSLMILNMENTKNYELSISEFNYVHRCPECSPVLVKQDDAVVITDDGVLVPRFSRLRSGIEATAAVRERAACHYARRKINARDHGWKKAYNQALCVAGEVDELFRLAQEETRQSFWRAIIGCYPVHNLNERGGGGIGGRAGLGQRRDEFEGCDECGPDAEEQKDLFVTPPGTPTSSFLCGDDDYDDVEY